MVDVIKKEIHDVTQKEPIESIKDIQSSIEFFKHSSEISKQLSSLNLDQLSENVIRGLVLELGGMLFEKGILDDNAKRIQKKLLISDDDIKKETLAFLLKTTWSNSGRHSSHAQKFDLWSNRSTFVKNIQKYVGVDDDGMLGTATRWAMAEKVKGYTKFVPNSTPTLPTTQSSFEELLYTNKEEAATSSFFRAYKRIKSNKDLAKRIKLEEVNWQDYKGRVFKESAFDPGSVSASNAQGYWQIMPDAQSDIQKELKKFNISKSYNLQNPDDNMVLGIVYSQLEKQKLNHFLKTNNIEFSSYHLKRLYDISYNLGRGIVQGVLLKSGAKDWDSFVRALLGYAKVTITQPSRVGHPNYQLQYRDWFGGKQFDDKKKSIKVPKWDWKKKKLVDDTISPQKLQESINYAEVIAAMDRYIKEHPPKKDNVPKPITVSPTPSKPDNVEVVSGKFNFDNWIKSVDVLNSKLSGKVFVLDPGHGGIDPGAETTVKIDGKNTTLYESELPYDITLRLAKYLKQQGAIVHVTHYNITKGIVDSYNPQAMSPQARAKKCSNIWDYNDTSIDKNYKQRYKNVVISGIIMIRA